jgi:transcription elongation factor Elf1
MADATYESPCCGKLECLIVLQVDHHREVTLVRCVQCGAENEI